VSSRPVLVGMIEDTARPTGRIDIVRELVDGMVGDRCRAPRRQSLHMQTLLRVAADRGLFDPRR
jgi:hypothetical protein